MKYVRETNFSTVRAVPVLNFYPEILYKNDVGSKPLRALIYLLASLRIVIVNIFDDAVIHLLDTLPVVFRSIVRYVVIVFVFSVIYAT